MMKIPRFALVLVLLPALLAVLTCKRSPGPSGFTYNDRTRLPEDNASLLDVVVRNDTVSGVDTVYLIYSSGATKPTYQSGDILFGKLHGGYMKKVVSTETRGDTLVVLTEQASLPDVFSTLHVDTIAHMIPTELNFTTPDTFDAPGFDAYGDTTEYKVSLTFGTPRREDPDSSSVRIIIPDLELKASWPAPESTRAALKIKISEVIYTVRCSVDAFVHIGLDSTVCNFDFGALDSLELRGFSVEGSVSLDLKQELCKPTFVYAIGPVPMTFEIPISTGVVLGAAARVTLDASLVGTFGRHAWFKVSPFRYFDGGIDLSAGGGFVYRGVSGQFAFWSEPYFKIGAGTYIAGCVGPYVEFRPHVRGELTLPPLAFDCKVGVSGELGVKAKFLGWEVKEAWKFIDQKWPLYYQREILTDNMESYPLGKGIGTPWSDSVQPPSWLGIAEDTSPARGRFLLLSDTSVMIGSNPSDYDSSEAWAYLDAGALHYDVVDLCVKTSDEQCDVAFRALGDLGDPATCSWYLHVYDGKLCYNDGSPQPVYDLTPNQWYYVTVRVDWHKKVYDIYVNGLIKVKDDAPFRGSQGTGTTLQVVDFKFSEEPSPGVGFDNLLLWTTDRAAGSCSREVRSTTVSGPAGWR